MPHLPINLLYCYYLDLKAEHSLELHTPFIARVMKGREFKLVPIMVGSLSTDRSATHMRIASHNKHIDFMPKLQ